jgi:hypothetical protein
MINLESNWGLGTCGDLVIYNIIQRMLEKIKLNYSYRPRRFLNSICKT